MLISRADFSRGLLFGWQQLHWAGDCRKMFVVLQYVVAFVVPIVYIFYRRRSSPIVTAVIQEDNKRPLKSIMQAAREDLAPPKDDPYTSEQLKQYDGSDPTKPIFVAIKGSFHLFVSLFVLSELQDDIIIRNNLRRVCQS